VTGGRAVQAEGRPCGRPDRFKKRGRYSETAAFPCCARCRNRMTRDSAQGKYRWRCVGCRVSCMVQTTRAGDYERRAATARAWPQELRPHCVACQRAMNIKGEGWKCPACGAQAKTHTTHSYRRDIERPACRDCGRPKALASKKRGRRRFLCGYCYGERKRLRGSPEALVRLLKLIDAALPAYLTPDEREDAAQEVMLDILAAKLAPRVPEPRVLRHYATRARALVRDPFRFISLSQPTEDGREFGDTLAA
jgi:hypothetical protein